MIHRLYLNEFKNYCKVSFDFGPFTVVVGANAAGKSNLRDAFRFLHGLSRGYTLAETIGEKWIEGGVPQWFGIRGGTVETPYHGKKSFMMIVTLDVELRGRSMPVVYGIGVDVRTGVPRVFHEALYAPTSESRPYFNTHPEPEMKALVADAHHIQAQVRQRKRGRDPVRQFLSDRPILTQVLDRDDVQQDPKNVAQAVLNELESMRFLDLSPEAMRRPSLPGQTVLSDRGENLASVLQALHEDEQTSAALLEWVRALTPMDVQGMSFDYDAAGKVILRLIEEGGRETSVYSASDGTLRLLAMIAALLGPHAARFYFLEELEAGIHPARIHLLLDLIERQARRKEGRPVQVVASTHSPHLLRQLSPAALQDALLVYRPENAQDARVTRLLDVPGAPEQIEVSDVGRLHETEWFENVLAFSGDGAVAEPETP